MTDDVEFKTDKHGLNPPAYIRFAEGLLGLFYELKEAKNQGPNFDPRIFPIGSLVAAGLDGDDVIDASPEEIEEAVIFARNKWAHFWGLGLDELLPDETR